MPRLIGLNMRPGLMPFLPVAKTRKNHTEDQELVPPAFTAFTRQKYLVTWESGGVVRDKAVVLWFTTVVANVLTELT